MNIGLIYFSPTENTAQIASTVKEKLMDLNIEVKEFNITNYSERQKIINLEQFDAFIFGFPIYYWRAPRLIREWLLTLEGNGKKCSVFFTYGGVHVGLAHNDIKNILTKQNFKLISSAEFVAKHSYNLSGWSVNVDRPNQKDLEIAKEYTQSTYEKFIDFESKIVSLKSQEITEEQVNTMETAGKRAIPIPMRKSLECSMCRICEELCPTNSMDADKGKPNRRTCIRCLRCVLNCPDEVLKPKDMTHLYPLIKDITKLTDEIINNRESKYFV